MLQDFLLCLESNLTEIKKHSNTISNSNSICSIGNTNKNHHSSKSSNEPKLPMLNEEKYWNPELEEKEVENVFQNIYRSHTLTHVFWGNLSSFSFVSLFIRRLLT